MIFASYTYAAFLLVAFALHWVLPVRARRPFLILCSYGFYCSWDWRFAFLLLGVTVFNWAWAKFALSRSDRWLIPGVLVNLAPLFAFKYAGFALENLVSLFGAFDVELAVRLPAIVLPLGISFFTFQGIAYLVDVATGSRPFVRFSEFALYKSFWPQLIAGPIVRPEQIHDQIVSPVRSIGLGDFNEGAARIVRGLGKKVIFADTIGRIIDPVFAAGASPAALDVAVAAVGFGLQVYFDFSGYSDIAIGSARLFGFVLPENFAWPYAARSPQEFWGRWHITLSSWIRDYLFTPLAFTLRARKYALLASTLIAMGLCGLWHGARWTFVVWGVWHGVLIVLNQTVLKRLFLGLDAGPARNGFRGYTAWALTFGSVAVGWLAFRAESLTQLGSMLGTLMTLSGGVRPAVIRENGVLIVAAILLLTLLAQVAARVVMVSRVETMWGTMGPVLQPVAIALILCLVIVFHQEAQPFVYFQF